MKITKGRKEVTMKTPLYLKDKVPALGFLDIETAPTEGLAWGAYDTNLIRITRSFYILCFSWQWQGGDVHTHALPDYKEYKKDRRDDTALMETLSEYLDKAEVVVAHNGDNFDMKKINARMLINGITPYSDVRQVDTLKACRQRFGFERNNLAFVAPMLGVGDKLANTGVDMWEKCIDKDKYHKKEWDMMRKYNAHDVVILEQVYRRIRPWIKNHPNMGALRKDISCTHCGSDKTIKSMVRVRLTGKKPQRYQQRRCKGCWRFFAAEVIKHDD
jgi:hypothetical protein